MTDRRAVPTSDSVIDLRSDTLAPPTEEMWEAMRAAELGLASGGGDRSVKELESLGAEMFGKGAAIFLPTCSLANLLALMTLGERGTQVVLEADSHIMRAEEWGIGYICGVVPRVIRGIRGVLDPDAVEAVIRDAQFAHLPRTSLVCLENSHNRAGGIVITPRQTVAVAEVANRHGASVHLDGARLFNSAVALGVPAARLAEPVDTVSISLNKGLGAPFGALLCGSRPMIEAAWVNAKRVGSASIHKAGLLAAAGMVALTKMVDRLADDNRRAAYLAKGLAQLPDLRIDLATVQTNLVYVETKPAGMPANEFVACLTHYGVLAMALGPYRVRFVTHRLIGDAEVERAVEAVAAILG